MVSNPYRYSTNSKPITIQELRQFGFQTLIGILQTNPRMDCFACFSWFQTLIGILQTGRAVITLKERALFQTLIGILQTRVFRKDGLGC